MKLNFSLLRNCAFAVTLLSLPQMSIYGSETNGEPLQKMVSKEGLTTATDGVFTDTLVDNFFSDEVYSENLVANNKKRRKRNRSRQQAPAPTHQTVSPHIENIQASGTWVPRFVWMGEVKDNTNLKAFATFLIGSLDQEGTAEQTNFNPGVFMTPNGPQATAAHYNSQGLPQDQMTSQKTRRNRQRRGGRPPGRPKLPKARISLDLAGGASFLFFTGYKGDLTPLPQSLFPITSPGARYPVKGSPLHNVTPFFEMDATFNVFKWLGFGPYLQSTQGISIRTKPFQTVPFNGSTILTGNFSSDLDLSAIGGRVMFNISNLVKFKTWCFGIVAGGGAGVGFQTWKNTQGYMTSEPVNPNLDQTTINMTWGTRYVLNLSYTGDAALTFKSRNPYSSMTMLKLGCKFVGWGRSKELGKARNPGYFLSYFKPVSFKGIFSVVPYMGFDWSF